jgi:hypothetical protein
MLGFDQFPTATNMDTWIMKEINYDSRQYGPIRSYGALGYTVTAF